MTNQNPKRLPLLNSFARSSVFKNILGREKRYCPEESLEPPTGYCFQPDANCLWCCHLPFAHEQRWLHCTAQTKRTAGKEKRKLTTCIIVSFANPGYDKKNPRTTVLSCCSLIPSFHQQEHTAGHVRFHWHWHSYSWVPVQQETSAWLIPKQFPKSTHLLKHLKLE